MKRKITIPLLIGAMVLVLSFTSCNRWLDKGDETFVTWATLTIDPPMLGLPDLPYYFITDDTLVLCPMNHKTISQEFKPTEGQRLILYFSAKKGSDEGAGTSSAEVKHYIDIVQILLVVTKDIVYSDKTDTLGTDKVDAQHIWVTGGVFGTKHYLNMQLFMPAMEPTNHTFDLSYDITEESSLEDGYYPLELHHNGRQDPPFVDYTTRVSFILEGDCRAEGVKGLKIKVNTINQGVKVYTIDYY
ncbi:MAG: hypothetical protein GX877_02835 [Bacteroidales bacterium]|nr:hypothetical protein [Bacteroidales bacterium]